MFTTRKPLPNIEAGTGFVFVVRAVSSDNKIPPTSFTVAYYIRESVPLSFGEFVCAYETKAQRLTIESSTV